MSRARVTSGDRCAIRHDEKCGRQAFTISATLSIVIARGDRSHVATPGDIEDELRHLIAGRGVTYGRIYGVQKESARETRPCSGNQNLPKVRAKIFRRP